MYSLGFLGAGRMGGALIGGLKELSKDTACLFFDSSPERCREITDAYGIEAEASIGDMMTKVDGAVIAVKPQVYPSLALEIAADYRSGQMLLSIMAGITLKTLGEKLPPDAKIVRLMPNLAMSVGSGVCLMSCNGNVTETEKERLREILSPLGLVKEIPETLMNAGTALSGSGPAFCYALIEGLTLGGIRAGFSRDEAEELAVWTMKGAAELLTRTGESAAELKDRMMSAAGTTVEGICVLEKSGFRGNAADAVMAACRRGGELSEGS